MEVDEESDARWPSALVAGGLDAAADGRTARAPAGWRRRVHVYDAVRDAAVGAGLALVRIERRRHQLQDLFRAGGAA